MPLFVLQSGEMPQFPVCDAKNKTSFTSEPAEFGAFAPIFRMFNTRLLLISRE
jgi:hypothetical protein